MRYTNFYRTAVPILISFVLLFVFSACSKNDNISETTAEIDGKEENAVEIDFREMPFLMEALSETADTRDWTTVEEYDFDGFKQILYKSPKISEGETDLFSAILINDKIYDFGKVTYYYAYWNQPDKVSEGYKTYKIHKVTINPDLDLYKIYFLYGADSSSNKYFKLIDGIPYVLVELYKSWEADVDKDGSMETVSNAGSSTAPQVAIYEWTKDKLYYFNLYNDFNNSFGWYDEDSNTIEIRQYGNDYKTIYKYRNGKLYEINI